MPDIDIARQRLKRGAEYPYDALHDWWHREDRAPPPAKDWAHAAARGIVADMSDRGGIKHEFAEIDEEVRVDIIVSIAAIIRAAHEDQ